MILTHNYSSLVKKTGPGDLPLFRDAVLTYCAALRAEEPFYAQGPPEALELLRWMGIQYQLPSQPGRSLEFGDESGFPASSLADFRVQGYLGVALFAALVRSSYGPDDEGFFPTRAELGFYYDQSLLRSGPARWDQDYLDDCQAFFFEELTPAELVRLTLDELDEGRQEKATHYRETLEGVAFLVGEGLTRLTPLVTLFSALLTSAPLPSLAALLEVTPDWSRAQVEQAWNALQPEQREGLRNELGIPRQVEALEVLYACGAPLLRVRAQL